MEPYRPLRGPSADARLGPRCESCHVSNSEMKLRLWRDVHIHRVHRDMQHYRRARRTALEGTEFCLFLDGLFNGQKPHPKGRNDRSLCQRKDGGYRDDSKMIGGAAVRPDMHWVYDIRPAERGHAGHIAFRLSGWDPKTDARRGKSRGAIPLVSNW